MQLPDHGQRKKEYPYLLGYLHICTMNLRIIRGTKMEYEGDIKYD